MEYNKKYWKIIGESNNIESIKKQNQNLIERQKKGEITFATGIKLHKESMTKSYKYIGEKSNDDLSIIKFKTEVYRDVAQNQISIFDILNQ
jgi:hypothetical protein